MEVEVCGSQAGDCEQLTALESFHPAASSKFYYYSFLLHTHPDPFTAIEEQVGSVRY